jgi:CRISPR/Cas system-associated exonuclease Cas4 (RecB family)
VVLVNVRYVSASEFEQYALCPRSYFFRHLKPRTGKTVQMLAGVRLHEELERLLKAAQDR